MTSRPTLAKPASFSDPTDPWGSWQSGLRAGAGAGGGPRWGRGRGGACPSSAGHCPPGLVPAGKLFPGGWAAGTGQDGVGRDGRPSAGSVKRGLILGSPAPSTEWAGWRTLGLRGLRDPPKVISSQAGPPHQGGEEGILGRHLTFPARLAGRRAPCPAGGRLPGSEAQATPVPWVPATGQGVPSGFLALPHLCCPERCSWGSSPVTRTPLAPSAEGRGGSAGVLAQSGGSCGLCGLHQGQSCRPRAGP